VNSSKAGPENEEALFPERIVCLHNERVDQDLPTDHNWHTMSVAQVVDELKTDAEKGLTEEAALRRRREYGSNELQTEEGISWLAMFFQQLTDFMVLVLLGATAISLFLGEMVDAVAIMLIVVLNAVFGFVQEFKAERALDALQKLAVPHTRVIRNGEEILIAARDVVPGDVVVLQAGDRVPADARIVDAMACRVDESILTGESVPVSKTVAPLRQAGVELAERTNMLFMGTSLTRGGTKAIVTATGMNTQIGLIAGMIHSSNREMTPLQLRLQQLGKSLLVACLLFVGVVFAGGVWRGFSIYRMFLTAVSLAVAAIPEGLPAIVTISLAIGVQRMIRRNAIIRRLPAVETLGCTTVVCSDKTGTLTQNQMTVRRFWFASGSVTVTGTGYEPKGVFEKDGRRIRAGSFAPLRMALFIGALCNHARLRKENAGLRDRFEAKKGKQTGKWQITGDPTEGALVVAAYKAGINVRGLRSRYPLKGEIPFDGRRKCMSVIIAQKGSDLLLVKGAPEVVLQRSQEIITSKGRTKLDANTRNRILRENQKMADQALRVLALAYRPISRWNRREKEPGEELENGLVFVGLAGMIDPPRPEVRRAIVQARRAGLRTIMVTGDHLGTAIAVGRELGLVRDVEQGYTGSQLEKMTDAQLQQALQEVNVFARVSPAHKLRIVKALKQSGNVVGMTGDGVNDAPAVKEADIGIAMGKTGTDVTKEAAAMVLADDNYATIIAAVEEGRGIYDNIRKFVRYLLGCNVGEVLTMFAATVMALPMPLIPVQILWMNLVTDGLPAIALGIDPVSDDVMDRPPRDADESIFARGLHVKIIGRGLMISVCTLIAFYLQLRVDPGNLVTARTIAFSTLVMSQLFYVFECRSETDVPAPLLGPGSNMFLVGAVVLSVFMHLLVIYSPVLQPVFKTVNLDWTEWLMVLCLAGGPPAMHSLVAGIRGLQRSQHLSRLQSPGDIVE